MNDVIKLIYITSEISNGEATEVKTEKEVFCEINSLSFEEQTKLQNANFSRSIKCLINQNNDSNNLAKAEYKGVLYEVNSKDRFKASDQITLLLGEINDVY